jgi:UDP-N-acetylmuramoyl-tripeptide--D-alanyl-D-alanine ligase
MIDLTVARIAEIVGGTLADISPAAAAELHVTGTVEFDSRAVGPGGLFLALPGARSDGHDHAGSAVAAGAVAVLAARPVGVPAIVVSPVGPPESRAGVLEHDADGSGAAVLAALAKLAKAVAEELVAGGLTIIGITGSSGKTSTKDLVAAVLEPLGEVVAPPGSFNNELGHPWTVLRATPSTDYLVLEMSARHPGNIAALADIAPPAIGVVLNVGTAHLGEFGSRDAIARTKAELPQAVPPSGVVILNVDDPVVAAMAHVTAAWVVRVSRAGQTEAGHSDVWADGVSLDELARPRFTLHAMDARGAREPTKATKATEATKADVQLGVSGDHQVTNALCAAAVALQCGASLEQVAAALAEAGPASRHRMQVTTRGDGVTVIDDAYNANPDSMRAGLQALAWIAHGDADRGPGARRSWAVLGEMAELGDDAIEEHDRIGRLAVRLDVSRLVVVGTGRSMSAMHHGAVLEGAWGSWGAGGERGAVSVPDAAAALALLRAQVRPGDVVLVKASNAAGLGALADALATEGGAGSPAGEARP